jgi:hypothetical protein
MEAGKHVYVQKPLAWSVRETRVLREVAKRTGVVTQMGNQGHSSKEASQINEWIEAGIIGPVREVRIWTNRPIWPQGIARPLDATQLARSAYLLLQCQEHGARCVVALTMIDEAKTATPEPAALAALLGCEVIAVTARTRLGLPQLTAAIERAIKSDARPLWRWERSNGVARVRLIGELTASRECIEPVCLNPHLAEAKRVRANPRGRGVPRRRRESQTRSSHSHGRRQLCGGNRRTVGWTMLNRSKS